MRLLKGDPLREKRSVSSVEGSQTSLAPLWHFLLLEKERKKGESRREKRNEIFIFLIFFWVGRSMKERGSNQSTIPQRGAHSHVYATVYVYSIYVCVCVGRYGARCQKFSPHFIAGQHQTSSSSSVFAYSILCVIKVAIKFLPMSHPHLSPKYHSVVAP